jgi:E3 ubiquitin-protein ligase EDD1
MAPLYSTHHLFLSLGNHPRLSSLGLTNERVVLISGSNIRCSVVTESGKVATWMDESLAHVCAKLEQSAAAYPELFGNDKVGNSDR